MLRDAKEFKKAMLEAKHELELELTRPTMPPVRAAEPAPAARRPRTPEIDTADEVADAPWRGSATCATRA